ncbi:MAG: hypothetical protein QM679_02565 [Patulibacter sp.]
MRVRHELVQQLGAFLVTALLARKDIVNSYATVASDPMAWDVPALQRLDEVRARDQEKVTRLLSREFLIEQHERDRPPDSHRIESCP